PGGAVTRTGSVLPCQPTISSRRARGCTRTETTAPSGLVVLLIRAGALVAEEALIHLDRRAERFRHLVPRALEPRHLRLHRRRLGARHLEHLFGLQLGLPADEAALLHALAALAGGPGRLLEDALAILEAARPLLQDLELLLQQGVLLEKRLVVSRQIVEERVHLVRIEAAEHLHGELLLANVHRRD